MADRPKVTIGYLHGNELADSFADSLMRLIAFDQKHTGFTVHDRGRMSFRVGTDGLATARNAVAEQVVGSDVDWLLWIDSDMGFAQDALVKLMAEADPVERPIVGGLCFAAREFALDGMGGFRSRPLPTIYNWVEGDDGERRFVASSMYPVDSLVRCQATGSAFVLIHRSVFERTAASRPAPGGWYDRLRGTDGSLLGEDISFCVRAGAAGIPIHIHTGVRTTHLKPVWLSETDHWMRYVPPPATEQVAVIVPVMRRPQNAEPFMTSLRASTGLATVYAVCDVDDDTYDAWRAAGADVISFDAAAPGTFAEKVNAGYAKTSEPWLFLVGDDVRFHPGWLDHAQHVAQTFGAHVVGTNDLGNPRVLAGEHATHLLVRRSYVDETGASWDGPGVVAHEGYGHWFVDDELVTAAKQRGVWSMALGSVVEHLHPIFGKGEDDDVYALGQSHADADQELFERRLRANT